MRIAARRRRHIGRWRDGLEPWEVSLCETVLGRRMARFGYELTGAGRPPLGHLIRYARDVRAHRRKQRSWRARESRARANEPNPVAARLTSSQHP